MGFRVEGLGSRFENFDNCSSVEGFCSAWGFRRHVAHHALAQTPNGGFCSRELRELVPYRGSFKGPLKGSFKGPSRV